MCVWTCPARRSRRNAIRPDSLPGIRRRWWLTRSSTRPVSSGISSCRSYVATYLERDLRSQLQVGSLRDFERFLRACALRTAQLLNKADLARDVGISPSTAGQWLSVLERSGVVVMLEPWFSNCTKVLVKTPKLHFQDTGLCGFLMGVSSAKDLVNSPPGRRPVGNHGFHRVSPAARCRPRLMATFVLARPHTRSRLPASPGGPHQTCGRQMVGIASRFRTAGKGPSPVCLPARIGHCLPCAQSLSAGTRRFRLSPRRSSPIPGSVIRRGSARSAYRIQAGSRRKAPHPSTVCLPM